MTQLHKMPEDGQFVAVRANEGVAFSQTFLHDDGELLAYDFTSDDWILEHGYSREFFEDMTGGVVIFFQLEGV